jgi:hypothetical protein
MGENHCYEVSIFASIHWRELTDVKLAS